MRYTTITLSVVAAFGLVAGGAFLVGSPLQAQENTQERSLESDAERFQREFRERIRERRGGGDQETQQEREREERRRAMEEERRARAEAEFRSRVGTSSPEEFEREMERRMEERFKEAFQNREEQMEREEMPEVLHINPAGKVQLVGATVRAVSGDTLEVGVWGQQFSVAAGDARLLGVRPMDAERESAIGVEDMQEGDSVFIKGTMDRERGVVTAEIIRNPQLHQRSVEERVEQQRERQRERREGGGGFFDRFRNFFRGFGATN